MPTRQISDRSRDDQQDASQQPILIIGPPRSGTTLLATMLNAHSRLFVANEAKVFVQWLPRAHELGTPVRADVLGRLLDGLERNEMWYHAPLPAAPEVLEESSDDSVAGVAAALLRLLARREGKVRWGEKTAVAYREIDLIREAYPRARYLCLRRDPEQIAESYAKVNPKWGALGGLIDWLDFKQSVARQGKGFELLEVSYHELVADPETTLRQVCTFIGEEYEVAMLDFHRTERARRIAARPEYAGSAKPLYTGAAPAGRVRHGWRSIIYRASLRRAARLEQAWSPRPVWERLLRTALFLRASGWELTRPNAPRRLLRRLRSRLG